MHRRVLVTVIAAIAMAAVSTASAAAASWHVGGEALSSSAPLASTAKAYAPVNVESFGYDIECRDGLELESASISSPNGGSIGHLVFTGCTVIKGARCSLPSEKIETDALKIEAATGTKPEDTLTLKPASGVAFAEIELKGAECEWEGGVELRGYAKLSMPKGQEELAEQELSWDTTESSRILKWGGGANSVAIRGSETAKLSSGKDWSFH